MTLRGLFAAGAIVVAVAAPAAARDLTVVTRNAADETLQTALRQVYFGPFSDSTGIPVAVQDWSGGLDALRGRAADWDIVQLTGAELQPACDQGLIEKLDWSAIGGRDHYLSQAVGDCGIGAFMHSTVLSWDRDKFPATPTWQDFWDIAKYPGKRGLRRSVKGNLEIALMADGVAPGDVYGTLRSGAGVDRAFRKLDQLKPYLVWWQGNGDATRILGSGEVLMSSAPNDRVTAADRTEHRNFGIQWGGSLYQVQDWAIIKDSPNLAQANRFLAFVGDPAREASLLPLAAVGGLARQANDKLAPDLLAVSPSAPANLAGALQVDAGFWRDNEAKLSQRFEDWLGH